MQIKVIKKDSNTTLKVNSVNLDLNSKPLKSKNFEQQAEHNISKWITELREKKDLEFLKNKTLLQGLKHAV